MPSSRSLLLATLTATFAWSGGAAATGAVHGTARWRAGAVTLAVDPSLEAIPSGIDAVQAASRTWKASGAPSPALSITRRPADAVGYVPGKKNQSTIRFAKHGEPLAKGAVAITVLTYEAATGTILDADVILNGVYRFGDADEPVGKAKHKAVYDVQSVLTHELGHLHGLADDRDHDRAAMYAWTAPGETHKRELAAEDDAALLVLYPLGLAADESEADAASSAACSSVPGRRSGRGFIGIVLLVGAGAIALRRRVSAGSAAVLVALGALGAPASASAAGEELIQADAFRPSAFAVATVSSAASRFEGGLIVTELELADVSCAGECDGLGEHVRVAGGQAGGIVQVVSHAPVPEVGARVRIEVSASEDGLGRHRVAEWVTTDRSEP